MSKTKVSKKKKKFMSKINIIQASKSKFSNLNLSDVNENIFI